MVSNTVRFFKIGFFLGGESNLAIDVDGADNLLESVWRGPYNHVISQSFSLVHFSKAMNAPEH
jgi:hypothetical protein